MFFKTIQIQMFLKWHKLIFLKKFQFTEGVFDSELFLAISQQFVDDNPAYMEAAKAIAIKCGTVTGSRCDQAVAFDKCMEAEIKERNLDPQMI